MRKGLMINKKDLKPLKGAMAQKMLNHIMRIKQLRASGVELEKRGPRATSVKLSYGED